MFRLICFQIFSFKPYFICFHLAFWNYLYQASNEGQNKVYFSNINNLKIVNSLYLCSLSNSESKYTNN